MQAVAVAAGMTNEQYFSQKADQLIILEMALELTPENKILKRYVEKLRDELRRP